MKMRAARAYRTVEYASGWNPCVRMYRLAERLSDQRPIADSSITSTDVGLRISVNVVVRLADAMAEPTFDDIEALVGPATPHFAFQIRARVRELIGDLPEDDPVRRFGEAKIRELDDLGYASSKAADDEPEEPRTRIGWDEIPSSAPVSRPLPRA